MMHHFTKKPVPASGLTQSSSLRSDILTHTL